MRANPETVGFGPIISRSYTDGNLDYEAVSDGATLGLYGFKRTYTSSNTPGYYVKKRLRQPLPFHDYSSYVVMDYGTRFESEILHYGWTGVEPNLSYGVVSSNQTSVSNTCGIAPGTGGDDGHIAGAATLAENRLRSVVGGMSVNLAQALGERKQTANLLASSAKRLFEAGYAIRKGNLQAASELLGLASTMKVYNRFGRPVKHVRGREIDIGNVWLEYKYGWKPLMQDIYGSMDLLTRKLSASDGLSVEASGRAYDRQQSPPGNVPKWSRLVDTSAKMSFVAHMEDEAAIIASASGISNPLLLAWELIPYSFVFDWLMPVGNYLEGLTAYDGFRLSNGCLTQKTSSTYVADYSSYGTIGLYGAGGHLTNSQRGLRQQRTFRFDRTSISRPPLEAPVFRSPIGGDARDRFATAASLVRQFIPSERKEGIRKVR